ncbi:hypothetical protein ACJX0J_037490, partial [Zea mays]
SFDDRPSSWLGIPFALIQVTTIEANQSIDNLVMPISVSKCCISHDAQNMYKSISETSNGLDKCFLFTQYYAI